LAVPINGNRGKRQEISTSTKVSKEIVPFQHEFPIQANDIKNYPIGHRTKNPTPTSAPTPQTLVRRQKSMSI